MVFIVDLFYCLIDPRIRYDWVSGIREIMTGMVQTENKWERITLEGEADRLYSKPRSFAEDVWFRFRHKPTALLGLVIIVILLFFAIAGPSLTPYGYDDQNTKMADDP